MIDTRTFFNAYFWIQAFTWFGSAGRALLLFQDFAQLQFDTPNILAQAMIASYMIAAYACITSACLLLSAAYFPTKTKVKGMFLSNVVLTCWYIFRYVFYRDREWMLVAALASLISAVAPFRYYAELGNAEKFDRHWSIKALLTIDQAVLLFFATIFMGSKLIVASLSNIQTADTLSEYLQVAQHTG
jgi:hypothetical protein